MKQQFDLFGTEQAREPEVKAQSTSIPDVRGIVDEIEMVRRLEDTGRYRVLRKLESRAIADAPRPGFPLRGVIDAETTGLNVRKDRITETSPGPDVAPIHDRQIVVLAPNRWADWICLSGKGSDILAPLSAGSLHVEQVRSGSD